MSAMSLKHPSIFPIFLSLCAGFWVNSSEQILSSAFIWLINCLSSRRYITGTRALVLFTARHLVSTQEIFVE